MTTAIAKDSPWVWLTLACAAAFVVAAVASAAIESPTVDEFAHVPAGVIHWRQARFNSYQNNPPLGKMWVAVPVALDPHVVLPSDTENGVQLDPWIFGRAFEQANLTRYLSLLFRARLMVIPLVLAAATLVYLWSRSLFGPFAASMSASLFLLSPTILAHGHLATVDIAAMASIFAAAYFVRKAASAAGWLYVLVAAAFLGVALCVKFTAIILVIVLPLLFVVLASSPRPRPMSLRVLAGRLLAYAALAWFVLNAVMLFHGTFDAWKTIQPSSKTMANLTQRLPARLPLFLPRDFVEGVDSLQQYIESGNYRNYLHGVWSGDGWPSYYFIAFAIKETEPVVVLTLLALPALLLARIGARETIALIALPLTFLAAAALNPLCLGIRYVLPVFPFLFVMIGAVFSLLERILTQRRSLRRFDTRWWIAAPLIGYGFVLAGFVFPSYLAYFNQFIGGPSRGERWLLDSNLDWGQDLHRLPAAGRAIGVDRWRLAYFGRVDPAIHGISFDLPTGRPEFGVYAVSTNYRNGMPYFFLTHDGFPETILNRIGWMEPLVPTSWAGSIAIFDLRDRKPGDPMSPEVRFNLGLLHLFRGESELAARFLEDIVRHRPQWAEARYFLASTDYLRGQYAQAADGFRAALRLRPDWTDPMNDLAWVLATCPDDRMRNGSEALRLAQDACRLSNKSKIGYLDTLAAAFAEAGRFEEAVAVCQEGIAQAQAIKRDDLARSFLQSAALYRSRQPLRSTR